MRRKAEVLYKRLLLYRLKMMIYNCLIICHSTAYSLHKWKSMCNLKKKLCYSKVVRSKVKVPCNRPQRAQRWSRSIALLILDLGARKGWVVSTTPQSLFPRQRPGAHCTRGWVGPRSGLDVCEKSRSHRDSIPGPSSP
jgi:hypothetical protein